MFGRKVVEFKLELNCEKLECIWSKSQDFCVRIAHNFAWFGQKNAEDCRFSPVLELYCPSTSKVVLDIIPNIVCECLLKKGSFFSRATMGTNCSCVFRSCGVMFFIPPDVYQTLIGAPIVQAPSSFVWWSILFLYRFYTWLALPQQDIAGSHQVHEKSW